MDSHHDGHSGPHHSGHHHSGMQHHHQMFFSWSTYSVLLLKNWSTATVTGLLLGAAAGVVLSLCLEALKCYICTHNLTLLLFKSRPARLSTPRRLYTSLLHALDLLVAYVLMLLVMSFNVYIIIAVVLGAGLGHWLIRPAFLRGVGARLERRRRVLSLVVPRSDQPHVQHCCVDDDDDDDVKGENGAAGIEEDPFDEVVRGTEGERPPGGGAPHVQHRCVVYDDSKGEYGAAESVEDAADHVVRGLDAVYESCNPTTGTQCRQFTVHGKETSV